MIGDVDVRGRPSSLGATIGVLPSSHVISHRFDSSIEIIDKPSVKSLQMFIDLITVYQKIQTKPARLYARLSLPY